MVEADLREIFPSAQSFDYKNIFMGLVQLTGHVGKYLLDLYNKRNKSGGYYENCQF